MRGNGVPENRCRERVSLKAHGTMEKDAMVSRHVHDERGAQVTFP